MYDITTTPDSASAVTTMLSSSCTSNTLGVVALASASLTTTFPITPISAGLGALTPDGKDALLSLGILGTSIQRVSLSNGAVTTISSTSVSLGIAVRPDGGEALVVSGDGDTVNRVSLSSNTVTGAIDYAGNQDSHNVAITPDGSHAVVVGSFNVGLLSLAGAGSVVCKWSGGGRSVAITPNPARALVTLSDKLRIFTLP